MHSASWLQSHSELRRVVQDPDSWQHDDRAAHAAYMLRQRALQQLGGVLRKAAVDALAIKGAGLAADCYPRPWQREMTDIDLLVRRRDLPAAERALLAAGCRAPALPGRPHTRHDLGAQMFVYQLGSVSLPIDLHAQLDKIVTRPIDYDAVFARARATPSLEELRIPDHLDHLLFVVLHAATSGFTHDASWIDLELLLRENPSVAMLIERARAWRLATPTWLMLETLSELGSSSVPRDAIRALRPPQWQRRALKLFHRLDELPVASPTQVLGWRWAAQQTPLRDDPLRWMTGLARYAVRRVRDRVRLP